MLKRKLLDPSTLRVLAYHRIAKHNDHPILDPRTISATPFDFAQQMQYVRVHYQPISVLDVLDAVKTGRRLPNRPILITFDDAYTDFAETAWPALKRLGLPVTLFVPTAYASDPNRLFWWDRLHCAFQNSARTVCATPLGALSLGTPELRRRSLRVLQDYIKTIPARGVGHVVESVCMQLGQVPLPHESVLSWERLRQLAREGVTLGSHTHTHPILTQLAPVGVREEIRESLEALKRETGSAAPIVCFPNGSQDDKVVAVMREEGIVLGFTTATGINDMRTADLLRLKRIVVTARTSLRVLAFRLHRVGAHLDAWRLSPRKRAARTFRSHQQSPVESVRPMTGLS